ncbi:MAG: prepilin-type N-terminal cleavage/methylation domain-containing protein [Verrucomicrobiaceae bacterium]|jgi:prepilin-type N-terminal cleavage/methylation domain-containing protein|nr:prepilin-type N-terminal cleavage/methylation domain-containing protein [Verrucomicrobiaceae bacterium]
MNFSASQRPLRAVSPGRQSRRGFSLVEMMACVSIIGIIAFMAIPSVTRMRTDSERNLAISRAEALNLAQASFIQVRGRTQAALDWSGASTAQAKYALLQPYLSFSESTLTSFMPLGYSVTFPASITTMQKASLTGPTGIIYY